MMSQQQFEFRHADQEGQEGERLNTDPREQRAEGVSPDDQVAAGPLGGQKIYPRQPVRRRRGLWIALILLIVLLVFGASGYVSNSAITRSVALPEQSLHVVGAPTVIIDGNVGSVHIRGGGDGSSVVLSGTESGNLFSNPNKDVVRMTENADDTVVTITVRDNGSTVNHEDVDLQVTLPTKSDVQARLDAGALDIKGVSGKMNLQVNAGELKFENGTLLDGSTFRGNAGDITFKGQLAANGNYVFENNAGEISLFLKNTPSFTLKASANVGKVTNKFGTDTVGPDPASTTITATTDVGDITVRPA